MPAVISEQYCRIMQEIIASLADKYCLTKAEVVAEIETAFSAMLSRCIAWR